MKNVLHLNVASIDILINLQHLSIETILIGLIEYAQHLNESIVNATMKQWYLHNYSIMNKALHKRIGDSLCHLLSIIVVVAVVHLEHRLVNVAHTMPEQIDGNHRQAITIRIVIFNDICRIGILRAKILPEA